MFYMAAAPGAPVLEAAPHASHVPEHDPLSLTPPPPLSPSPRLLFAPDIQVAPHASHAHDYIPSRLTHGESGSQRYLERNSMT